MTGNGSAQASPTAERAVSETVEAYFQAIHKGDTQRLGELFHPTATLVGWDEGQLRRVTLEQWFRFVESIPSPASQGAPCDGQILSIDVSGTAAAAAIIRTRNSQMFSNDIAYTRLGMGVPNNPVGRTREKTSITF